MNNLVKIAVDAMGGDGSPKKIIDGITHHYQNNKDTYYQIFWDQNKISNFISNNLPTSSFEIIHTTDVVKSTNLPLLFLCSFLFLFLFLCFLFRGNRD